MNKTFTRITTAALSALILTGGVTASHAFAAKNTPYKINAPLSISTLKLEKNTYISDFKNIDIDMDKIKDNVILVGVKDNKSSLFFDKLNIIIENGKTKKYTKVSIGKDACGYTPQLFLGDFNGDKAPDAFISMPTGGSGGIIEYALYSLKGKSPKAMINEEKFNEAIDLSGNFTSTFMASLKSNKLNKTIDIDLSSNKDYYIENNIYDKDGQVKDASEISSNGFSELKPIDKDKNGIYELEGTQRIVGFCNANTLGYLNSTWKMKNNEMQLDNNNITLTHIFTSNAADLNGDGIEEYFNLNGVSTINDSTMFVENISIDVYDGKTNTLKKIPVCKENSGYTPRLTVEDLNNDKIPELLVSIPSGGSGGMEAYSLISLKNNEIKYLLDESKFCSGFDYTVDFKDGYTVDVNVKDNNKSYTLDISDMKDIYNELKLYDSNGKLVEKTTGMNNPLSYLEVKDMNGKKALVSYQRVIGTCNAETLGYVKGTWSLEGSDLKLVDITVDKK
jgi:hypothetical protein